MFAKESALCLCLWPRSQRSGINFSGSGNISGSIWVKEPALTTIERAGMRNPPITTSLSYTLTRRNVVGKIFTTLVCFSASPGCAPNGGEDPLRFHLHRLDVLHLGQGGLGQLPLGADGVADLPVQGLSLVGVGGQMIQEKGCCGTWKNLHEIQIRQRVKVNLLCLFQL